jgi:hypothetical protein
MKVDDLYGMLEKSKKPEGKDIFADSKVYTYIDLDKENTYVVALIANESIIVKATLLITKKSEDSEIEIINMENFDEFSMNAIKNKKNIIQSLDGVSREAVDYITADYDQLQKIVPPFIPTQKTRAEIISWMRHTSNSAAMNVLKLIKNKKDGLKDVLIKATAQTPDGIKREKTQLPQKQVNKIDYPRYVQKRASNIWEKMEKQWREIKYDNENPLQETIAENFYSGKNQLLLGETGIGKTYNPVRMAVQNNIHVSMIQFDQKTDAITLQGVDVIKQGIFDSEASMHYRYGTLARAFLDARERAKEFQPTLLILDELLRTEDMSPLISSLSEVEDTKEYNLILSNIVEFVKLQTSQGEGWFAIADTIDNRNNWYTTENKKIEGQAPEGVFITDNESLIAEMNSRGDLPVIRKGKLKELGEEAILGYTQKPEEIRVPKRAMAIIATSNVGERYEVMMGMDNALFRRLAKVPMVSPSAEYMVKQVLSNTVGFSSDSDKKMVGEVITSFLTKMQRVLGKDSIFADSSVRVNFSTVDDIISGLDKSDPFKADNAGFGGLFRVLKSKAMDFVDLDPDMSAADLLGSNIKEGVETIVNDIETLFRKKEIQTARVKL